MKINFSIKPSDVLVRKVLPSHLVAGRIHRSKVAYSRQKAKRGGVSEGW